MTVTSRQAQAIAALKSSGRSQALPIREHDGTFVGRLIPVTHGLAGSDEVVAALYRWRKANLMSFLTVFTPTIEKTTSYLVNFSLPDPARILFLVSEPDSRLIGNIGLCNVDRHGAEMDNVIRGEAPTCRDIMTRAQWTLLDWAFSTLGVPLVYLNVLADNARAIRAYQRAGFSIVKHVSLVKEEMDDGYRLVPPASPGSSADAQVARMEISSAHFRHD
jgi:RimJ/RimL family protein N-acetyltransferase